MKNRLAGDMTWWVFFFWYDLFSLWLCIFFFLWWGSLIDARHEEQIGRRYDLGFLFFDEIYFSYVLLFNFFFDEVVGLIQKVSRMYILKYEYWNENLNIHVYSTNIFGTCTSRHYGQWPKCCRLFLTFIYVCIRAHIYTYIYLYILLSIYMYIYV